ncbi:MAG TPA: hypothetical protein VF032_08315 [Thermoleophilaceae bacterium]
MESLTALLLDPRRLAELGPTEEEVMADLLWPAPLERARRH